MDGPRNHGCGARSGYDVRTRCIRGCSAGRQGESPFRLNGWDAVVSSLGTGLGSFREVILPTVATRALVTAMTRNGVRRLVSISALGVGGRPSRRLRVRPAVPAFAAQPCLQGQ